MNLRLYLQTLRWNRVRLITIVLASLGWGMLIPVIYVNFADAFKELANSGAFRLRTSGRAASSRFPAR
jgi:hypothetical protein